MKASIQRFILLGLVLSMSGCTVICKISHGICANDDAPCSTGMPGVCAEGTLTCGSGSLSCVPNTPPSAEVCDGQDNDCNGEVDEGNPGGGQSCTVPGEKGICTAGITSICMGGTLICQRIIWPMEEECNGLDDDCDGEVDEGNPGGGSACQTQLPGICAAGREVCTEGKLFCERATWPNAEECNGLDDDCDGEVDEGNPGGGGPCKYTGGVGICAQGTLACTGGGLICVGRSPEKAETCNGLDDDCDSKVDEDTRGSACATGMQGVCRAGKTTCEAGNPGCIPITPASTEACNGLDDDCDGHVDEDNPGGGSSCDTRLGGDCAAGATSCTGGELVCKPRKLLSPETCDGKDNDCDGKVDEDLECHTFFSFSASQTNSARQNTKDHQLTLTPGQTLEFGTCPVLLGSEEEGEVFLRLFNPAGQEVTMTAPITGDRQGCSRRSYIKYTVPPGGGGTYTIKAGCFLSQSCSGTVRIEALGHD